MKNRTFFDIWVKTITSEDELKKRLQTKALKLKNGESAQFFVNGETRYLQKENNKFKISKDNSLKLKCV